MQDTNKTTPKKSEVSASSEQNTGESPKQGVSQHGRIGEYKPRSCFPLVDRFSIRFAKLSETYFRYLLRKYKEHLPQYEALVKHYFVSKGEDYVKKIGEDLKLDFTALIAKFKKVI